MARPIVYIAKSDDTYSTIARATTGSDTNASLIQKANPGASWPFEAGQKIFVPRLTTDAAKTFKNNGLDIRVGGNQVTARNNFVLSVSMDGFRRCEFTVPNEIQTRALLPQHKALAVDIGFNGNQIFTGYLESPTMQSGRDEKSLTVICSSYPNVLNNKIPANGWPLDLRSLNFEYITREICGLYGLPVITSIDTGPMFKKASAKRDNTGIEFLTPLAKQRGLILTDDAFGTLVIDDGASFGAPVWTVDDENDPSVTVAATYNFDDYYAKITGLLKNKTGQTEKFYTEKNPHFEGILKYDTVEFSEIDLGELETATRTEMGRMFGAVFSVSVEIPSWLNSNGVLFQAGELIKVRSPREYINNFFELQIRRIDFAKEPERETATLECILPDVFRGVIPEVVPWT